MGSSLPVYRVEGAGVELPAHLRDRTISVNERAVDRGGEFVVCWLHHAVRDHDNPALDVAVEIGNAVDRPVLVYLGMSGGHRYNSDRHVAFMLEGVRDLQRGLDGRGIGHAFFCPKDLSTRSPLRGLAGRAACVVTEDFPAPPMPGWTRSLAGGASCAVLAVDCDGLVPVRGAGRRFDRAFKFRDKMKKGWRGAMREVWADATPAVAAVDRDALGLGFEHRDLTALDSAGLAALIGAMDVDHSVGPVVDTAGGSAAGYARWEAFCAAGLRGYAKRRNNALAPEAVSRISAYLHYGHVSVFRLARDCFEAGGTLSGGKNAGGADKFLDELLVWRELAHNFCAFTASDELETAAALPGWAVDTLRAHDGDPREVMDWETLSRGRTGDAFWDTAQWSYLANGELHNNVRMTWGKALPGWTRDVDGALFHLFDLNHRYALDGSDPNSYGGLLWCLGQFDRPFDGDEPVLGSVRGRDTATHAERLDPARWGAQLRARSGRSGLRVGVVGGGLAGLSAARVLADHGCAVRVWDKGRGPGGRMSARYVDVDGQAVRIDHGCPSFGVTDARFGRYVRSWIGRGVAARHGAFADGATRVVGVPSMDAVVGHVSRDLSVSWGRLVTAVERDRESGTWRVWTGERVGVRAGEAETVDALVVAVPGVQGAALLRGAHDEGAGVLEGIAYDPVLTLLAVVRGEPGTEGSAGADGVWELGGDGVLGSVHRVDVKPGRGRRAGVSVWAVHATAGWSRAHVDGTADAHHSALLEAFGGFAAGIGLDVARDGALAYSAAHRWRYGRVVGGIDADTWFDGGSMLALAGDGFGRARGGCDVERAWLSGQAAAGRVLTWHAMHHPWHGAGAKAEAAGSLFAS